MRSYTIEIPNYCPETDEKQIRLLVGQSANENTELVANAEPTDLWIHVKDRPSCHVIAHIPQPLLEVERKKRKDMLRRIRTQAAVLCKQNSKYASEKQLELICTEIKNVHPTTKPGEVTLNVDPTVVIC
jgi:predicted ribosome quality control (RQC) complex YloA/Tae2 family protein